MNHRHVAALFAAWLVAAPAAGTGVWECKDDAPLGSSVRLDYDVVASRAMLSISGEGVVVFRRAVDSYTMESTQKALGIVEARQSSTGSVGRQGLVPRSFVQQSNRRPPRHVEFDWAAQRVTFGPGGTPAATEPQMQDRLSLLFQLAWRQRAEPDAAEIELPVATQRTIAAYRFSARGREALELPAGRFETVKYERHQRDGDEALEVWVAPALCSLPVRLRFSNEKGLVIEQRLRAVQTLPP
jgi:hypothetical protein